jgi:hypothetical protein
MTSLSKQCLQQGHCQTQPIKARPWIFILKGKALNFSCAVAPTRIPLLQVTNHQANSSMPSRLEPPLLDPISRLPYHSSPAPRNENMLHDINSQQSFEALPLKPNGQSNTRVCTTKSHPIRKTPGMKHPVERRWSLPEHATFGRSIGTSTGISSS